MTLSVIRKPPITSAVTVTPINPSLNDGNKQNKSQPNKTLNVNNSITVSSVNVPAMVSASKQNANRSSPINTNTKLQKTYSITPKNTRGETKEITWTSRNNAVTLNKITVPVSSVQPTAPVKRNEQTNSVSTMNIGHTQVVTITTKPNESPNQERYKIQNIGDSSTTTNRGNVTIRPISASTLSSTSYAAPSLVPASNKPNSNLTNPTKRITTQITPSRFIVSNNSSGTNVRPARNVAAPKQTVSPQNNLKAGKYSIPKVAPIVFILKFYFSFRSEYKKAFNKSNDNKSKTKTFGAINHSKHGFHPIELSIYYAN